MGPSVTGASNHSGTQPGLQSTEKLVTRNPGGTTGNEDGFVYSQTSNMWLINGDSDRLHVLHKHNLHCDYHWNWSKKWIGGGCSVEWLGMGPPDPMPQPHLTTGRHCESLQRCAGWRRCCTPQITMRITAQPGDDAPPPEGGLSTQLYPG
jgi:hypothetical protein